MSAILKAYDRSRVPLYIQVASVLRQRIESGRWAARQRISTLEELEREFKVARVTVRQAVDLLRSEGLLVAQQGRGTFVAERTPDRHWLKLETSWDRLVASVKDNKTRRIVVKDKTAAPLLGADDGEPAPSYVFLRSVQCRVDEPYSIVDLHLARRVFDLQPDRFMTNAALAVIADLEDVRVLKAHQTLVIGSADPGVADLLEVPLGTPTVHCHSVVIDATGTAIYVADIIYRSDCVKLQIDLYGGR